MSPPTPKRPPREPDGTYRGDETDNLIDALIEAQSVNQAGFYTASDNAQRLARHELRAHIDRRLRAVSAAERPTTVWAVVYSSYADDECAGLYQNEADAHARVKELGGGMWEVGEWTINSSFTPRDAASPEPPTEPRL